MSNKYIFPLPHHFIMALLLVLTATVFSCKSKKGLTDVTTEHKSPAFLFEKLRRNEVDYKWLRARIAVSAEIDKKNHSFKAIFRSRKDSVIWLSVSSLLNIEVVRMYITPDSVKFINRLAPAGSKYFAGGLEELQGLFQLDFDVDFDFLQAVITGNYYPYYADSVFKASAHGRSYSLQTVNRRKLKRKYLADEDSVSIIKQDIRLDPVTYKIIRIAINDLGNNRKFETQYSDFEKVESYTFPHRVNIDVNSDVAANLQITYSKVMFDKPQNFPFSPPE